MRAWVCFAAVMLPTASSAVAPELKRMATTVRMKPAMSAARAPVLKMQYGHDQQGWATAVDDNYYYDEQQGYTGQYNEQQGHNGQLLWNLAGNSGVRGFSPAGLLPADYHQQDYRFLPYSLRNGQEQLLSRWNMVRQKPTVSRMQCSVAVSPDGVATLTSYGKGPTLWRQQHGWSWRHCDGDEWCEHFIVQWRCGSCVCRQRGIRREWQRMCALRIIGVWCQWMCVCWQRVIQHWCWRQCVAVCWQRS